MKKNHILLALITVIALFISSCDIGNNNSSDSSTTDSVYTVTLSGSVVDGTSGNAISGATIRISDGTTIKGTTTDAGGDFSTTLEVTEDIDYTIIAAKDGYLSDTTNVFAIANSITEVPIFQLQADENNNGGTGTSSGAASINLFSQSASAIGVKESGSIESAEIVFEVRDSSGALIDESHAVDVSFTFGSTPGGGEYLYPASVKTNTLAKAPVTLNTGTVAGVVQVIAEATVDGKQIKSKPILIAIYGGFPEESLFYVASEKLNYPVLGVIGSSIEFTAYAGDKYNNPVRPGTAIYFTTNYGIIGGSNLTGDAGTASVTLLTEPWPEDPVYGPGFFRVTARTANESMASISTETVRLQSGSPIISANPSSFNIDNGGSQSFTYTVKDVNDNPMSEGQSVNITVKSQFYDVAGATEVKFPDTQSKSWTAFSFIAFDTDPDTVFVENVTIEIATSGSNGNLKYAFSGSGK